MTIAIASAFRRISGHSRSATSFEMQLARSAGSNRPRRYKAIAVSKEGVKGPIASPVTSIP